MAPDPKETASQPTASPSVKKTSTPFSFSQPPITNYTKDVWQTLTKKRKISTSPPTSSKESSIKVKNLPLSTSNRFAALASQSNESDNPSYNVSLDTTELADNVNSQLKSDPKNKPPPIFVQGVTNYKGMVQRITQIIPSDHFTTKAISNEAVKLSISDIDSYRKIMKEFHSRDIKCFTYQVKSERHSRS